MLIPFATPEDIVRLEGALAEINSKLNKVVQQSLGTVTYNPEETSKILSCSLRTLQNYRERGLIGYSQLGSKIWFTQKDIDDFLLKYRTHPKAA